MPTPHIEAQKGEIADKILLPGDPLRAKFIAENFLEDAVQFNQVRGMLGFTGTYKGHRVSVMGTGMGIPSISIYANELITEYGVKRLIRVGTAGSVNEDVHIRDLVIGQAAATTSAIIRNDFPDFDFPQIADFDLLDKAYHIAKDLGITTANENTIATARYAIFECTVCNKHFKARATGETARRQTSCQECTKKRKPKL